MKLDSCQIRATDKYTVFRFISTGNNGTIQKNILFQPTEEDEDVYNLAFGDEDEITGELNDMIVSNNGDTQKILATIVLVLFAFFENYPLAIVYATGSTASRTQLYQMGISKYFQEMSNKFEVLGQTVTYWELFRVGGSYTSFLVKQKFI